MPINTEQRQIKPSATTQNLQYVVVSIIMFMFGMSAVFFVTYFHPTSDNGMTITAILGFTGTTLASILAFMKSQETHASVNSRMDDFIKKFEATAQVAQDKARLEGLADGKIQGRQQADDRTDFLVSPDRLQRIESNPVVNPVVEIQKNTKDTVEILKEIKEK